MSAAVADRVSKVFGDAVAVDDVTVEVGPGEVVGLLGANGAGKTTTIRLLLGLLAPTSGRVSLLGGPPDREARRRIGYVPQGLGLYTDLGVAENLRFIAGAFGSPVPSLPGDLADLADTPVGRLPLGIRRRVAFVAALGHQPELLVLDEPTSGVGPVGRAALWDTIHEAADADAAVLVTTHSMDEAEQCDRLVIMAAGRAVATGSVADVIGDRRAVEVTTDAPARLLDTLAGRGIVALPSGGHVRAIGVDADAVRAAAGDLAHEVRPVAATLEEAFVELAAGGG